MYGYPIRGGFNLVRLLSGLSKTLNVANQVIPMYKKAKPTIENAKTLINTFKNINIIDKSDKKKEIIKKEPVNSSLINKPQFFI